MKNEERIRCLKRLTEYKRIAEERGIHFITQEVERNVWNISVEGEEGSIDYVPTRKVAQLVHGLFLMGDLWRKRRLLGKSPFKTAENVVIFPSSSEDETSPHHPTTQQQKRPLPHPNEKRRRKKVT